MDVQARAPLRSVTARPAISTVLPELALNSVGNK